MYHPPLSMCVTNELRIYRIFYRSEKKKHTHTHRTSALIYQDLERPKLKQCDRRCDDGNNTPRQNNTGTYDTHKKKASHSEKELCVNKQMIKTFRSG